MLHFVQWAKETHWIGAKGKDKRIKPPNINFAFATPLHIPEVFQSFEYAMTIQITNSGQQILSPLERHLQIQCVLRFPKTGYKAMNATLKVRFFIGQLTVDRQTHRTEKWKGKDFPSSESTPVTLCG